MPHPSLSSLFVVLLRQTFEHGLTIKALAQIWKKSCIKFINIMLAFLINNVSFFSYFLVIFQIFCFFDT